MSAARLGLLVVPRKLVVGLLVHLRHVFRFLLIEFGLPLCLLPEVILGTLWEALVLPDSISPFAALLLFVVHRFLLFLGTMRTAADGLGARLAFRCPQREIGKIAAFTMTVVSD